MAKNTLKEVQKRMQELNSKKIADLDAVREKQIEAQTKKEAAEIAIKNAIEEMDVSAYKDAEKKRSDADLELSMYAGKYSQIEKQEYITEKESDAVIDSLLSFEDELAEEFKNKLFERLTELDALQRDYYNTVIETEQTMRTWTNTIHANYRSRGTTIYSDGTDRSSKPIAIRNFPFNGCLESRDLRQYLDSVMQFTQGR